MFNSPFLKKMISAKSDLKLVRDPSQHILNAMRAGQLTMQKLIAKGDQDQIAAMAAALAKLADSLSAMYLAQGAILTGAASRDEAKFTQSMNKACDHMQKSGDASEEFAHAVIDLAEKPFNEFEHSTVELGEIDPAFDGRVRDAMQDSGIKNRAAAMMVGVIQYADGVRAAARSLRGGLQDLWRDAKAKSEMLISPLKATLKNHVSSMKDSAESFKERVAARYELASARVMDTFMTAREIAGDAASGTAAAVGSLLNDAGRDVVAKTAAAVGSLLKDAGRNVVAKLVDLIKSPARALVRLDETIDARAALRREAAFNKAIETGDTADLVRQLDAFGGINTILPNSDRGMLATCQNMIARGEGNAAHLQAVQALLEARNADAMRPKFNFFDRDAGIIPKDQLVHDLAAKDGELFKRHALGFSMMQGFENDDAAVLAMLQAAKTELGAFQVVGSDEFKVRAFEIAAANGIAVTNAPVMPTAASEETSAAPTMAA